MITKRQTLPATLAVAALMLLVTPAYPQPQNMYQLRNLAWRLSAQADRAWSAVKDRSNAGNTGGWQGSMTPQTISAVQRFHDEAKQFAKMTDTATDPNSLRDRAQYLVNEASKINNLIGGNIPDQFYREWGKVDKSIQNLAGNFSLAYAGQGRQLPRTYGGYNEPYNNPGYNPYGGYGGYQGQAGPNGGFFQWQGVIDGTDLIKIQGNRVWIEHLNAQPVQNPSYSLPNPLPQANMNVALNKVQGRGNVQVVEQPSAANYYTVTVRVEDPEGGASSYSFQLTW